MERGPCARLAAFSCGRAPVGSSWPCGLLWSTADGVPRRLRIRHHAGRHDRSGKRSGCRRGKAIMANAAAQTWRRDSGGERANTDIVTSLVVVAITVAALTVAVLATTASTVAVRQQKAQQKRLQRDGDVTAAQRGQAIRRGPAARRGRVTHRGLEITVTRQHIVARRHVATRRLVVVGRHVMDGRNADDRPAAASDERTAAAAAQPSRPKV